MFKDALAIFLNVITFLQMAIMNEKSSVTYSQVKCLWRSLCRFEIWSINQELCQLCNKYDVSTGSEVLNVSVWFLVGCFDLVPTGAQFGGSSYSFLVHALSSAVVFLLLLFTGFVVISKVSSFLCATLNIHIYTRQDVEMCHKYFHLHCLFVAIKILCS